MAALGAILFAALIGLGLGLLLGGSDEEERGAAPAAASGPTDPRPVEGDYDPSGRPITLGGGAFGGSVAFRPGTLERSARIVLDRDPPVEGPPPPVSADPEVRITNVADYFNVDARRRGGVNTGGDWDPPLELVIDLPRSSASIPAEQLIACFYSTSGKEHAWKPIEPMQPGGELARGVRHGFYLTGAGERRKAHIHSRHLTLFSIFREWRPKG